MARLKSKLFLKIEIIEVLSNETDFLSAQQIAKRLDHITPSNVRSACLDLQADFKKLYTKDEVMLMINKRRGVKLIRNNVNIQRLVEDFFMNDLSYNLYKALFLQKDISTLEFCEQNYISKSTLARYLTRLNRILAHHQIHVTLSDKITITGPVSKLLSNFQYYFFMVHRSLNRLSWFPDKEKYIQLTQQILIYLEIDINEKKLQFLSLLVLILVQTNKIHGSVTLDESAMQYHSLYRFKSKPDFLPELSERDWQFLLLSLYALDFIPSGKIVAKRSSQLFKEEIHIWLSAFETYFRPLNLKEKECLGASLDRQIQFQSMFLVNNFLLNILGLRNFDSFDKAFPVYHQQFELFWIDVTQKSPQFKDSDYHKFISFLGVTAIVNPVLFNPRVKIFVYSDFVSLHKIFIEKRINYYLAKYNIIFVADCQEADVIVSTTDLSELAQHAQPIVYIYASLTNIDLQNIEKQVDALFLPQTNNQRKSAFVDYVE
ncbi:helix-turn-helix domain-containing protein [Candidatus Enterococcus willemsii]|uniref:Mga helix-turn-helix domain-containing protein n=1 Tax=Candidatus Enterococcus willemsii TaxID=1857215 RepID=A0ABQ6Z1A9_9ENTE|nr:helix-turn-helix domain-containing protein [Enterococcus sp. CU12B]KAF1304627.1 hypothetical protein BAU17_10520 [Enterococcus sp. CU12B]